MATSKKVIASLLLIAGLTLPVDGNITTSVRIIGGRYATIEEFPFMAAVYKGDMKMPKCSASILSRTAVLGVTDCFAEKNIWVYRVVVGVTNTRDAWTRSGKGQIRRAVKIKRHPNPHQHAAVVIVDQPFDYSSAVKPLTFAFTNEKEALKHMQKLQRANAQCWSPGWGMTAKGVMRMSDKLKVWPAIIMTSKQCANGFCKKPRRAKDRPCFKPVYFDSTNHICASSPRAIGCLGDSGNPLVCEGNIVGMTSWMFGCDVGSPVAFLDVRPLLDVSRKYICEITKYHPA